MEPLDIRSVNVMSSWLRHSPALAVRSVLDKRRLSRVWKRMEPFAGSCLRFKIYIIAVFIPLLLPRPRVSSESGMRTLEWTRESIGRSLRSSYIIIKFQSFKMGCLPRPLFIYFRSFKKQLYRIDCRPQQDSNLDRQSRRLGRWPLDHGQNIF